MGGTIQRGGGVGMTRAAMRGGGLMLGDARPERAKKSANGAKGSFDGNRQSYSISANDQIFSAAEYRNVIIAYKSGSPVRLSDIGEVIDNVANIRLGGWVGAKPAVILDIQRQPGANIIEPADRAKRL